MKEHMCCMTDQGEYGRIKENGMMEIIDGIVCEISSNQK